MNFPAFCIDMNSLWLQVFQCGCTPVRTLNILHSTLHLYTNITPARGKYTLRERVACECIPIADRPLPQLEWPDSRAFRGVRPGSEFSV